jgi:hypothetical protein
LRVEHLIGEIHLEEMNRDFSLTLERGFQCGVGRAAGLL